MVMGPAKNCSPSVPVVSSMTSSLNMTVEEQETSAKYTADILKCYNFLAALPHLKPSLEVNQAFSELVKICTQIPTESVTYTVLKDQRVVEILFPLQRLCSIGEGNLEKHWAEKIVSASQNQTVAKTLLNNFPYYENYVDLTKMELSAISFASPNTQGRRFAFLGCGALPLTSLCILSQLQESNPQHNHQPFILNIDHCPDAIRCATSLCNSLSIPGTSMAFLCDDARGPRASLGDFDFIYVAALVGATSREKRDIFAAVIKQMRPGALLVVRTAHALRTLLYPAVEVATDLDPDAFEPLVIIHPYNHIINSVIIGRVRSPKVVGE